MADELYKEIFINRELSWLEFNSRVLALSRKKYVPIGEQLKFAAIYGSNLDEFFMVRVGSIYDELLHKKDKKQNAYAKQQLALIMPKVQELQNQCDKNIALLYKKLQNYGLYKVNFSTITKKQESFWKKYFLNQLFPVLSPQIIDHRHPFPFLRNQETYIGALLKDKKNGQNFFGLLPISGQFERVLFLPNEEGQIEFVLVEELLLHFSSLIFGKSLVLSSALFRVTRNADLDVEEDDIEHGSDYRVVMSELLKKRKKLAAVRLQFFGVPVDDLKEMIISKLKLPQEQCFFQKSPLSLSYLYKISARLQKNNDPTLFYPVRRPIMAPQGFSLYEEVQKRDVLLCFPYESIRPFILMLYQAARDPQVVSIKMTLYRVATDSKIIEALIEAAENGKEVVTIVELRARFDEQNNIDWSRQLEQAGCTVIYGFTDYKVHSKITLITRRDGDGYKYISQIGTGNYNEKTSELYTDLSYITSDRAIGEELGMVFNQIATEQLTEHTQHLIVAPKCFKSVLLQELETEIAYAKMGGDAQVILKCNAISDKDIIAALGKASQQGVPIQMIIRGICCLHAGIKGYSDTIVVRSIVGRYLEHSRIYAFGKGERLRIYIASGDFLTRNTECRVEVGVKIENREIQKILCDILEMQCKDTVNTWKMQTDGSYKKIPNPKTDRSLDSQMQMYEYLKGNLRISTKKDLFKREQLLIGKKPQGSVVPAKIMRNSTRAKRINSKKRLGKIRKRRTNI